MYDDFSPTQSIILTSNVDKIKDAGKYECIARNYVTGWQTTATLNISRILGK